MPLFPHRLVLRLIGTVMCLMMQVILPAKSAELTVGETIGIKPNAMWFETAEKLAQWQAIRSKGDAAALEAFETVALSEREAWRFENVLTVKVVVHDNDKHQLQVEMTAPGRYLGTRWFIAADALAPARTADKLAKPSAVEEIYILRSVRETRTSPASSFCAGARTKLADPAWEDQYTFRSVETNAADGRVTNDDVGPVGSIHACFGRTADAGTMELYGELVVHAIAGKAFGKCHMTKSDVPEKGLRLFGCIFELFDLPAPYVGGQLTTNSLTSAKLFGSETEPAGYTQVSIATIRLWKAH